MFDTLIYQLEQETDHSRQLALLAQLEEALQREKASRRRLLISLLYHRNWYVRQEAAFLVDRYGVPLNVRERFQFAYALRNFAYLRRRMEEGDTTARQLLFSACSDAAPRFRTSVLAYLQLEDCQTPEEEAWLHYAAGDYLTLTELGSHTDYYHAVVSVLQHGLHQPENPLYHRRQCAFCLEQLRAMEDASQTIQRILKEHPPQKDEQTDGDPDALPPPELSPIQQLLHALRQQGIYVDGQRIFPEIEIGTATGRITYRKPPLQTWSADQRYRRIMPPPGHTILRFDYVTIEPGILLHFLLERFLISSEDIPSGDIYLAVDPTHREAGKKWLNAVINGGGYRYAQNLNPFQEKLWRAIREFRVEVMNQVEATGFIELPGGKRLPLPEGNTNRGGRIVNRFVQGTASEVFNRAVCAIYQQFVRLMLPAQVYFLIFDELWVTCPPEEAEQVRQICRTEMENAGREIGLLVELRVREKREEGT